MKAAAIFLVTMMNQGHWIGGQPGTISVQSTLENDTRAATVEWQLAINSTKITAGRSDLANGKPSTVTITLPTVRAVTEAEWIYVIKETATGKNIAEGRQVLRIYPADILAPVTKRLSGKSLAIWDSKEGLPALFDDARIPFVRLDDEAKLQFAKYDLLIVGPDQLADRPFGQSMLLGQVQNGMSVLVLPQTRVKTLAGYTLRQRNAPEKLSWREGHGLLEHLRLRPVPEGSKSWVIQLPADEPALELVHWPREVAGDQPVPIDALMVTKSLGRGKIVMLQIPLGDWKQDPIAQLFLADAIDYLCAPPEPTPSPSQPAQPTTILVPRVPESQLLPPLQPAR